MDLDLRFCGMLCSSKQEIGISCISPLIYIRCLKFACEIINVIFFLNFNIIVTIQLLVLRDPRPNTTWT